MDNALHILFHSFVVSESLVIGKVVGQVQATDDDSGTFGQIEYRLYAPSDRYNTQKSITAPELVLFNL